MISFLHTSEVHIERFENLVRKFNKDITTKHYVNSDILQYALQNEKLDSEGFQQEIINIKKENPELIICTCSSYGAVCNKINNVKRIDYPIADYLVTNYKKIGLVFTAKSTENVSRDLLKSIATHQKKEIEIINFDCSTAWVHFENDNIEAYELTIANKIKKNIHKVDVIFLAQASMEGAKKHLQHINKEVFSSPEFGIENYLKA